MASIASVGRAQLILQALRVAQQLILTNLIITSWGQDKFADWILLTAVCSFFSILDIGIQTVIGNKVLEFASKNKNEEMQELLDQALGFYTIVAGGFLVLVILVALVVVNLPILGTRELSPIQLVCVFAAMSASFFLAAPQSVLGSLYAAFGQSHKGIDRVSVQVAFQTMLFAIALKLDASPIQLSFCYIGSTVIMLAVTVLDIRQRFPAVVIQVKLKGSWKVTRLASLSIFYFANPFASLLIQNMPIFLIGLIERESDQIVGYATSRTLVGLMRQLTNQFANAVAIELSRSWLAGQSGTFEKRYHSTSRMIASGAGLIGGVTGVVALPFIGFWTSGNVEPDGLLVWILVLGACFVSPMYLSQGLLQYTNRPRLLTVTLCTQAVIGAAIAAAVAPTFGTIGILTAFVFVEIVTGAILVVYAARKHFRVPEIAWLVGLYAYCAVGLLIGFCISFVVINAIHPTSIFLLAINLALDGALILPLAYILCLDASTRKYIISKYF